MKIRRLVSGTFYGSQDMEITESLLERVNNYFKDSDIDFEITEEVIEEVYCGEKNFGEFTLKDGCKCDFADTLIDLLWDEFDDIYVNKTDIDYSEYETLRY